MLASAGRSRSGDRFYNPPAVRRQLQLQQQQEELLQQVKSKEVHEQRMRYPARILGAKSLGESDDCASSNSPSISSIRSNLDRFLDCTTPLVPGKHFSKTTGMSECRAQEDELQPYFVLGDLWEFFQEWSIFGAGVPLLMNGSDSIVQYYVPYLSGIQLYEYSEMQKSRTRNPGQESDLDSSRESSDGSSDYETGRRLQHSLQEGQSQQDFLEASRQGMKGLSISNNMQNGCHSGEAEFVSSQSVLAFEFLARDPPYNREPLADKVALLSSRFPQLMTYKSCELSPASWVSVAWYPIYRIPVGSTLQSLDSCFLTFHSLSKPVYAQNEWRTPQSKEESSLTLPIFGLASYKFNTSQWEADESQKANLLRQAAADWLQNVNVNHPDYSFFSSYRSYHR